MMITVELEPYEVDVLLKALLEILACKPTNGSTVADMKAALARIEYLEGLK